MDCLYCGRNMVNSVMLRSNAHFCVPKHQTEYWKLRRKMERQQKRALDAMTELNSVLYGSTDLALLATDMLADIAAAAGAAGEGITWKCRECGQMVFMRPVHGEPCDYCDHEAWSVILPGMTNRGEFAPAPAIFSNPQ